MDLTTFLRGKKWIRIGAVTGAIAVLSHGNAVAQERRDDPTGARFGAFKVDVEAAARGGYDSNLFEEESSTVDTAFFIFSPSVAVTSDFSRHRVSFDTSLKQSVFLDSTDDNSTEFDAKAQGVLDVSRRFRLIIDAEFRRRAEQRGSDEAGVLAVLPGPILSNNYGAGLQAEYLVGDFRLNPFINFGSRNFKDSGTVIDQDDRDRRVLEGGMEVGYRLRTGYEAFIRAKFFNTNFDNLDFGGPGAPLNRDSSGVDAETGVKLQLSRLLIGRVGAGITFNRFDEPTFENTLDFTANVGLDWSPSRRLNISLDAEREVNPTNIAGASDRTDTNVTIGARYSILTQLDGFTRVGLERAEFNGNGRTDTGFFGRVGIEWDVNRRTALEFSYRFAEEFSTIDTEEFTKHLVTLGVRYGF